MSTKREASAGARGNTAPTSNEHLPADMHPEVPTPARRYGNTKSGPPEFWSLKRSKEMPLWKRQLASIKGARRTNQKRYGD